MDFHTLKREQLQLAQKIIMRDRNPKPITIGAALTISTGENILACVIVCSYPDCELLEKQTYFLTNPLPYHPEYVAYREMPAIIEAFNQLEHEPDLLLIKGTGIAHPRKIGLASHLGLLLNIPTIAITDKSLFPFQKRKVFIGSDLVGFHVTTKEHAKPILISPGHLITPGTTLSIISSLIKPTHKLPVLLHLAKKIAKKKSRKLLSPMQPQQA